MDRIKSYRDWYRKLEAFFRVSEMVIVFLFLLSRYSSGVSTAVATEFFHQLLCLLSKPLHVFFISNVIVLAVAVLSGLDAEGGKNKKSGGVTNGIYDEYVSRRREMSLAVGENNLEVLPVVLDAPEDGKRIVLFTSSGPLIEGGKVSNDPRMKAEKFTDEARLCRRVVSILHAPKAPCTAVAVPDTAAKYVILKSRFEASINGDKALPPVVIAIGHCVARTRRRERAMGDENPTELPSPRGRGRLVVSMRDVGSKTVEDMSNDEFNRSVANYIAKTRRFLREESMRETPRSF